MTKFSGFDIEWLRILLEPIDLSPNECDGCTRLISTLLTHHEIKHKAYIGEVWDLRNAPASSQHIPIHCWIDLNEDVSRWTWRIDYRLRMWWVASPKIPHGIFKPTDLRGQFLWKGDQVNLKPLPRPVFDIMMDKNKVFEAATQRMIEEFQKGLNSP